MTLHGRSFYFINYKQELVKATFAYYQSTRKVG
jgi:hypothetical protein